MPTLFLQDSDATILVADILGFSALAKKSGALTRVDPSAV